MTAVIWYLNGDDNVALIQACPQASRVAGPSGALKMLMDLDDIVEERNKLARRMAWADHQPSTEHPEILVIVDNYHRIFPMAGFSWSIVAVEGRKAGVRIEARGDDTSLEAFGYSDRLREALGKVPV